MRLLMAWSFDGFVARDRDDDMSWTGPEDKRLFRALTSVGGRCVVGRRTWELMPRIDGRELIPLSMDSEDSLWTLNNRHRGDVWLLGGPTIAFHALQQRLVHEAHVCTIGGRLCGGIRLDLPGRWRLRMETQYDTLTHSVWVPR